MDSKIYPRVLIIGNSFNEISGAGVTLTNLFKEWPKECIAVASNDINIGYCLKERPCHSFFSFISNSSLNQKEDYKQVKVVNSKAKLSSLTKLRKNISEKLGLSDIKSPYKCSNAFLDFYDKFSPQIIYSALGNIGIMRFMIELRKIREFNLAIHIWDDFIGRYNYRYFPRLWKVVGDKCFKRLLAFSGNICLSIGDKMSAEYKKRYGYDFIPFHNPVDLTRWPLRNRESCLPIITYTGKINKNTKENLLNLSIAVDRLNVEGYDIMFDIYTPDNSDEYKQIFSSYRKTRLNSSIPQEEIPNTLINSGFLFLPLGFDKKSIRYTHLSIPTKLTEYMISGTPILLNCPQELALYEYLEGNNAAIVCGNSIDEIYQCLRDALNAKEQCIRIAENARSIAIARHSTKIVRDSFRNILIGNVHHKVD